MKQSGFILALKSWIDSWRFIFRHGLSHYFIYPVIVSVLLAMGAVVFIRKVVHIIMGFIQPYFPASEMTGDWQENIMAVLRDTTTVVIPFVLWIISLLVYFRLHKYVLLVLLSPMMALLSEKTHSIIHGEQSTFSFSRLIQDTVRGGILAVRNLIVELALTLLIWIILLVLMLFFPYLIFLLVPFATVLVFLISCYYYGFTLLDYINERNHLNVRKSIQEIRNLRSLSTGLGLIFSAMLLLPFVGVALGCVTCTVAACLSRGQQ